VIQELPDDENSTNAFISVYLSMDDTYKVTVRNVYTFAMAFSSTGGFMTVTFLVTLILVQRI
jgi:hypothetical protein